MAKAKYLGKRKLEDDLGTKPTLKKQKKKSKNKDTTKESADSLKQVELLEPKSDQANVISAKEAAVGKKTLFVDNLPCETKIPNIIDFFKNVGQVVRVRLLLDYNFKLALEKKNGEYLQDNKIVLDVADIVLDVADKGATYLPPKYCIDHKVWYEEDLRRESLPIEEEDETPNFVEEVLFVANLSPQTKVSDISDFFNYVGGVVSVRLIVNNEGKHVGYGFVEFASAKEAKKALEKKNGEYLHDRKIFLNVSKTAPYPPRPKYNFAEKLCYEDYLRRGSLLTEEDGAMKRLYETPDFVEDGGGGNRMVVSYERRIAELEKQLADSRTSEPSRRSAEELRQDLDKERGISAVLTKQTAGFRKQVADLKASLDASPSRLEQFEVDHAFQKAQLQQLQAERHGINVEVADYMSRIERMRRHIIDNRAAQESLLTLSQVSGTYDCLQELVKSGTVIPSKTLLGLEADVKMWEDKVLGFDIADVLDSDLEAFPETAIVPTNLQAAEVPVVAREEVVMAGAPAGSGAQVAAEQ
ncbi:PREDICTED: uncharacterized protein LOC104728454 [Camelina sativa]|uniref:Uncharacterized protein LOC104728454 n=1 Tax=Camelina sativa TaxID=90675 RepID=A0ABM0USU4_CAMSA|nr:PREDICTED: uncharacterized protein LOC104728454 [Camelina sativa]